VTAKTHPAQAGDQAGDQVLVRALVPAVVEEVAALLAASHSVLFITGAGISADSGLPTYRGIGGLYQDADTEEGIPIEVALSGAMLYTRPEIAWRHIHRIEAACRGARFNRAHEIIAALEQRLPRVWVLTQNIDGFHRDAGSQNVIEIHGNVHRLKCTQCTWRDVVPDFGALAVPPSCERCGGLIRPDVVLFGEWLPEAALAENTAQLERGFDLVFSVGTTSAFPYIAGPVVSARRAGIPTVEINPGETAVSHFAEYRLRAGAKDALEALWQAYLARVGS
jgi:NAD-dependent deacetylase